MISYVEDKGGLGRDPQLEEMSKAVEGSPVII